MKRLSTLIVLLIVALGIMVPVLLAQKSKSNINNTMENRWKKVEEYASKEMVESALKEVEGILAQAEKEKDSPQVIKAMLSRMLFMVEKNSDEAVSQIRAFEALIEKTPDLADKAVMYSMAAQIYSDFYQMDRYTIDRRTEVIGIVPEDINEWTKNIFADKIVELVDLSIQHPEVLQKTDVLKYKVLLNEGKDSRDLQPTLFDFLAYRKIDLLKQLDNANLFFYAGSGRNASTTVGKKSSEERVVDTYDQLIQFQKQQNNKPATVYAELQKLKFEQNASGEKYLEGLEELEKAYKDTEAVVEVLAEKANYYLGLPDAAEKGYKKRMYSEVKEGLKRFPNYKRANLLKNILTTIEAKHIESTSDKLVKPATDFKIQVEATNITQLRLEVYKVNATAQEYQRYVMNDKRSYEKQLYPNRTLVHSQTIHIPVNDHFEKTDTALLFKTGGYGIYEFLLQEPGNKEREARIIDGYTVTDLAFIERKGIYDNLAGNSRSKSAKDRNELYVVDRISGKPLSDVVVNQYNWKWNNSAYSLEWLEKVTAESSGKYSILNNTNGNMIAFFERGNDKFFSSQTQTYWSRRPAATKEETKISLFTDRSIYRPGQTVYYKGIAYVSTKEKEQTAGNFAGEIKLFNTNREEVGKQTYTTNEFGSFAGSFVLPETGLNGLYQLQSNGFSIYVLVEEYKRPTFEVTLDKPKEEVRFGEKVTVKGNVKAYSGYPVSDASVNYRIVRRPHRFWWGFNEPDMMIDTGTIQSDGEGNFEVIFTPEKDKKQQVSMWRGISHDVFYTYYVYADVTDTKGETQQGEQALSVGDKSLFILATIPEKVDKGEKTSWDIHAQTLNGEDVQATVNYKVIRLENEGVYYEHVTEKTEWKEGAVELTGSLEVEGKLALDLKRLHSGVYKLVLTTQDNRGGEVKVENRFVLYDKGDKRPPVKSYKWMTASQTILSVGEKAVVNFGTSTRDTHVLYELMQGDSALESRWIPMSDEIKTFEIPFKESYGMGVTVLFTFIKDEQFFTERVVLTRKTEIKMLTPSIRVFRDKLKPGEKAEWSIHIPEAVKDKKQAELLIGMYDASLDALNPHSWSFNPAYYEWVASARAWSYGGIGHVGTEYAYSMVRYRNVPEFQFDNLIWYGFNFGGFTNQMRLMAKSSGGQNRDEMKSQEMVAVEESAVAFDMAAAPISLERKGEEGMNYDESPEGGAQKRAPQVRTNFNETAFFYPQLRTDESGNVKISFTAPESLTRWNVKMLAHTKDLYVGYNELEAVTQKELMVQMNLPRFVRRSDKLSLMANVVNLSEESMRPEVRFELIDPATDKVIQSHVVNVQEELKPKGTSAVEWRLDELKGYDLVVVKVVAVSGNFSDGEQKYLPVLSDKVLVTESQTMTLRAGQTRIFSFDSFIQNLKSVDTENFTVEYAGNPTWYAVQALPSVAKIEGENSIDYLTGYYANSLGSYIANANPALAATFERWKNRGGTRDALLSNLEKNQELKNMLLEETPWVMAAKDETEQKRQLGLLFDLNQTTNQAQNYLDKLLNLQREDGGFSWFDGMPSNRYITQEILLNIARMNKMIKKDIASDRVLWESIQKALAYLDNQIAKDYFELKRWNHDYLKKQTINNLQLFYLHTRSEYPQVAVVPTAVEAVKYYTAQSERYWVDWTLYGKAMMATVAYRNGKATLANEILTSLRENAMKTDELGMYWTKNRAGWFWYERPIATQTAIMEAFGEIRKASGDVDEMKIWLLKQKQTQRWDTPISTLDAIYALLNYGTDWLSNPGDVTIRLGNTELKPQSAEAGTAYIKETIPVETLQPAMGTITVESKSTSGISWGAAYWQYYQDVDRVQAHGKEMHVSKKLFVERVTNQGKTMMPAEQTTLKKGDKVITRLVVTTDRDLEFVLLKDLRAACFEPVDQLSGVQWKEGTLYYQTHKDASTQFFFHYLPKGTYVFEYELWVNNAGSFSSGMATIQCHYAPEFVSNSVGERIHIQ